MNMEFLTGLGLDDETAGRIMAEHESDVRELEGRLNDRDRQMDELRLDGDIDRELPGLGARNLRAARALLDMEALRASADREAELLAQLEEIRRENGYLFRDGHTPVVSGPTARAERGFGFRFTGVR